MGRPNRAAVVVRFVEGRSIAKLGKKSRTQYELRTNQEGADFKPPATKEEWLARRQQVRERILVSCGLYPMPDTPWTRG